eukprot:1933929-Rhodomonas_salina.2
MRTWKLTGVNRGQAGWACALRAVPQASSRSACASLPANARAQHRCRLLPMGMGMWTRRMTRSAGGRGACCGAMTLPSLSTAKPPSSYRPRSLPLSFPSQPAFPPLAFSTAAYPPPTLRAWQYRVVACPSLCCHPACAPGRKASVCMCVDGWMVRSGVGGRRCGGARCSATPGPPGTSVSPRPDPPLRIPPRTLSALSASHPALSSRNASSCVLRGLWSVCAWAKTPHTSHRTPRVSTLCLDVHRRLQAAQVSP